MEKHYNKPEIANRLARSIVKDITKYYEDEIKKGLKNDSLFDVLNNQINEGKDLYKTLVTKDIYETKHFYDRAIVDILVNWKKT